MSAAIRMDHTGRKAVENDPYLYGGLGGTKWGLKRVARPAPLAPW